MSFSVFHSENLLIFKKKSYSAEKEACLNAFFKPKTFMKLKEYPLIKRIFIQKRRTQLETLKNPIFEKHVDVRKSLIVPKYPKGNLLVSRNASSEPKLF